MTVLTSAPMCKKCSYLAPGQINHTNIKINAMYLRWKKCHCLVPENHFMAEQYVLGLPLPKFTAFSFGFLSFNSKRYIR